MKNRSEKITDLMTRNPDCVSESDSSSRAAELMVKNECGAIPVVEGKKVGFIGTVHPVLLEESKIRVDAALGEFDFEALLKGQPRIRRAESLSRFPSVQRDLALVMTKSLKVGEISKEIRKEAGPYLQQIDVFDVYEGDKLEAGQKSVAFRLTYQDKKDTLRDQAVNESTQKILAHLQQKFQITVR